MFVIIQNGEIIRTRFVHDIFSLGFDDNKVLKVQWYILMCVTCVQVLILVNIYIQNLLYNGVLGSC